jgi:hypothetical protein
MKFKTLMYAAFALSLTGAAINTHADEDKGMPEKEAVEETPGKKAKTPKEMGKDGVKTPVAPEEADYPAG